MSDTNLRPGVFDDTMPRRGIVKSNDLPHLEVVIADSPRSCPIALEVTRLWGLGAVSEAWFTAFERKYQWATKVLDESKVVKVRPP